MYKQWQKECGVSVTHRCVPERRPLPGRRAGSGSGAGGQVRVEAGPAETEAEEPGWAETPHGREWRRQRRRWRSRAESY